MNPNPDFTAALEQALGTLQNRAASAADYMAAAEQGRGAVRAIDEANESAPAREVQILAAMTSDGPAPRGRSIGETLAALGALDDETSRRVRARKVAVALAARLDVRARDAEKIEKARAETRKPLEAQTRRATDLAEKIIAIYPPNAARIVALFRDDVLISRLGVSAYKSLPRPRGSHLAIELTWHVPRVLATPEIMPATKLPDHWPPRYSDYSVLEQRQHFEEDDDEIIRPLRALINKKPSSESEVDAVIARAQAVLLAEYRKAAEAIEGLLRLGATITAADRELTYPDGARIFDEALFPPGWIVGQMSKRIKLPSITAAMAAE